MRHAQNAIGRDPEAATHLNVAPRGDRSAEAGREEKQGRGADGQVFPVTVHGRTRVASALDRDDLAAVESALREALYRFSLVRQSSGTNPDGPGTPWAAG
jgi:hypothetical protein